MIYCNDFTKVSIPNIAATKRCPLTDDEATLVTSTYTGHRMGLPALLLLYCGLRRGELIALTWNDIDINNRTVNGNKAAVFDNNQTLIQRPKDGSRI